ncbi:SMP-30/gluconolactonase/LRE family protein [Paenibacillus koleovorans]|uniref:SMP-30/gluconolactonase/LRE family protein n=1 Tax=Paenibacillus koleovorans TaxID=121608 RepID=UPI000FD9B359|nr:SMP-30/gluconolactonase/LRE family protein [Paenibacillus koleovorans]
MQQWNAELIVDAKSELGEGPCWDDRTGVLWWVDIYGKALHRYNPESGQDDTYTFDDLVTVVVPHARGGVVISFPHTLALFDPDSGKLETLVDGIEGDNPDNRFNDGKCDASGRLWIGTMSVTGKPDQGTLYCVDRDLSVLATEGGIGCSNGIAWSLDRRVMYYIDSPVRQVYAFDYDAASGVISNRRVAVDFGDVEPGVPDGMTIDDEGMLWVAHWGGSQVSRWDPATGRKLGFVAVPALQATSAMFGGPSRDVLYITSARRGMSGQQLAEYPLSGGLFQVKVGVSGAAVHSFG